MGRIALVKLNLEDYFEKGRIEWKQVFDLELGDDYFRFSGMVKVGIILMKPSEILLHISKSSIYGNDSYVIDRVKLPGGNVIENPVGDLVGAILNEPIPDPANAIETETVTDIPMKEYWGIDPSTDFDSIQEFLCDDKKQTIFVSHNNSNPMGRTNKFSDLIIKFDLSLSQWSALPKMKIRKSFCSMSLHGNRLFALGINDANHLCCEALDLDSEAWQTISILDNKMRIVELRCSS